MRLPDWLRWRGEDARPRIVCLIAKYPQYSETYMHEEMLSVSDRFRLQVYSYDKGDTPRRNHLPYKTIRYQGACLNWGDFSRVDTSFATPVQRDYLRRMGREIERFRPDLLHGHYLATSLLLRQLAEQHRIPFTLRTHSFDVMQLASRPSKAKAMFEAVRSPFCRGLFVFPEFRGLFEAAGIAAEKIISAWPVVNVGRFHNTAPQRLTRRILSCGSCTAKKAFERIVDFAASGVLDGYSFDIYAKGDSEPELRRYNRSRGGPVAIRYVEPEEMPAVYRCHDWLIYPTDVDVNEVGLPCSIVEAQASGIGICWQEVPHRRVAQREFLGGGGYLFRSYDELPAIIAKGYPEDMRRRGLENAWKCDVGRHADQLTSVWQRVLSDGLRTAVQGPAA